jgi:hypothetical protein
LAGELPKPHGVADMQTDDIQTDMGYQASKLVDTEYSAEKDT